MKHYNFPFFERSRAQVGISEHGHTYVFTFPLCLYEKITHDLQLGIEDKGQQGSYYVSVKKVVALTLNRADSTITSDGTRSAGLRAPGAEGNTNMVIELERAIVRNNPNGHTIRINGQQIVLRAPGYMNQQPDLSLRVAWVQFSNNDIPVPGGYEFPVVLSVFRESEKQQAVTFASAMRNPEEAIANKVLEDRGVTLAESRGIKQYKILPAAGSTDVSALNGKVFVMSFPMALFIKTAEVSLSFHSQDTVYHTIKLHRRGNIISVHPGNLELSMLDQLEDNVNMVVRVERSVDTPSLFATYVNGLLSCAVTQNGANHDEPISRVVLMRTVHDPADYIFTFVVFLTVFDDSEKIKAARFAEAIRNPHAAYFTPTDLTLFDLLKTIEEREKAVKEKEENLEVKDLELVTQGHELEAKRRELESKEHELADKGDELENKVNLMEQTEATLRDRQAELEAIRSALDNKETLLQDEGNELERKIAEWAAIQQRAREHVIQPSDKTMLQESMATAWPRAVKHVLPSKINDVKERHAELMSKWVGDRGDNLSPDAYDYLVYSHGVAWPRAVLETTSNINKLSKIRDRHHEIMEVLGYTESSNPSPRFWQRFWQ